MAQLLEIKQQKKDFKDISMNWHFFSFVILDHQYY